MSWEIVLQDNIHLALPSSKKEDGKNVFDTYKEAAAEATFKTRHLRNVAVIRRQAWNALNEASVESREFNWITQPLVIEGPSGSWRYNNDVDAHHLLTFTYKDSETEFLGTEKWGFIPKTEPVGYTCKYCNDFFGHTFTRINWEKVNQKCEKVVNVIRNRWEYYEHAKTD